MKGKKLLAAILCLIMVLTTVSMQAFAATEAGYLDYEYTPGKPNGGIMDFSWLNEMPAGERGFVNVEDGDFVFEDGTKVRFWGVNMGFGCATPEKEVAEAMAAEMASSGVNFVRLHAIDCTYSGIVNFTGFNLGQKTGDINKDMLDRMDYLVYCLKQKGIYVHLDINAGRVLSTGDGFTEEEVQYLQDGTLRGYHVFVERIADKELDFAKTLLNHQNPYTGMKYCEDPVFAVVQLMNESSVLWLQQGGANNVLTRQLTARFNGWLLNKYGTREKLKEAWTNEDGTCFLLDGEDPAKGTVAGWGLGCWSEPGINVKSYSMQNSPIRYTEFMSFLVDVQTGVFNRFYTTLRKMGYEGGINCSNYPVGPIDLYMNSYGDVTEKNAYWNMPVDGYTVPCNFAQNIMTQEDPRTTGLFLPSQMTIGSVADKATVITEWAATSPLDFKADAVFETACYAALQDWDGFCMFNYSFDGSKGYFATKSYTDFFAFHMDPAAYGQFGVCAAIFRQGLVSEAENSIEYVYTTEDIFANSAPLGNNVGYSSVFVSKFSYRFIDGKYDGDADLVIAAGNTASGDYTSAKHLLLQSLENKYVDAMQQKSGLDAWKNKYIEADAPRKNFGGIMVQAGKRYAVMNRTLSGSTYANVINKTMEHFGLLDEGEGFLSNKVVSDTGELVFDYGKDMFTAVTDSAIVIAGLPKGSAEAGGVKLTTANDVAALSVLAMDKKDIESADELFIYMIGRSKAVNMKWEGKKLNNLGGPTMVYEDIRGTLFVPSEASDMTVWGLNSDGDRVAKVNVKKATGGFEIAVGGYCYYEVEANQKAVDEPSNPDSSVSEPESSVSEPESSVSEPESSASEPESSASEPESSVSEPESSESESESSVSEPESSVSEPESSSSEPESSSSEPDSSASEPESYASEPESSASEPDSSVSEPDSSLSQSSGENSENDNSESKTGTIVLIVVVAAVVVAGAVFAGIKFKAKKK